MYEDLQSITTVLVELINEVSCASEVTVTVFDMVIELYFLVSQIEKKLNEKKETMDAVFKWLNEAAWMC